MSNTKRRQQTGGAAHHVGRARRRPESHAADDPDRSRQIIRQREIDSVMVHTPSDSHQDHRAANDIAIAAGRHVPNILFYQSPSTLDFSPTRMSTSTNIWR